MGTDDLFKKRRQQRKQRKREFKSPRANSFLIVTEGEKTEPLYFGGIQQRIEEKIGGNIDVVEVPFIDIHGEGCATGSLIQATERIVKTAKVMYQNIWVVFDKDDFKDFDQAIEEGTQKGYKIAWSNQSFEYWLYLHFYYSDSALHRSDWQDKLDEVFKQYQLGDGYYRKNYVNIYDLVDTFDGVNIAINNAKRRMASFQDGIEKPSQYDPGTMVYKLVQELTRYLEEK